MSEINKARTALRDKLVEYTIDLLAPERVHLYTPTTLATPTIWIGQPGVSSEVLGSPGAQVRVVRFGVYTLADGWEPEQCELLDELVARVWDAAYSLKLSEAILSIPQPIDVGGATQRAVVTDVGVTVFASSLCTRPAPTTPWPRPPRQKEGTKHG
jgi:hypothetical protein